MTGDWLIAALVGVTIAVLLGIGWHILINAAANTRRAGNRAGLIAVGLVFVAVALATSGWSLATAIGGKTAIEQHHKAALSEYETGLTSALSRVDGQRPLVEAVSVARSVYSGRVEAEIAGDNGRSGCGPNCRKLQAVSDNLATYQQGIENQIASAGTIYAEGAAALAQARQNIGTPQFSAGLAGVETAITLLNGINVTDGVSRVGMTVEGGNDPADAQIVGLRIVGCHSSPVARIHADERSRSDMGLCVQRDRRLDRGGCHRLRTVPVSGDRPDAVQRSIDPPAA